MSFKPIDAKRDEYRKYLERTGVMEVLCKAILKLFETIDKPENPVEFIRNNLGDALIEQDTIEHLKRELEDSQNEVAHLRRQLESLKLEYAAKEVPQVTAPAPVQESDNTADVLENNEPPTVVVEANPTAAAAAVEPATDSNEQQPQPPPTNEPESDENNAGADAKVDEEGVDKELDTTGDSQSSDDAPETKKETATNSAE